MKTSIKGALTAGIVGMILASSLATPANAAVIERDFSVTGPGLGKCRELDIEFYTP